ncbi:hypothetical protein H5410_020024 [Solanum commersonii]|uniref:Uncharacterized protein n=1 Tax=Solanum commersonii TaxID=4109 RepID=A0A9J5ZA07_SOLCO|nr:hypothetical protein H5410_020024 [Solanum commersonii]
MKAHIISCLLIFLFIHELVIHNKVDVAGGLNYLDRTKGGGRVPTPSPPNPNLRTHWWIPIEPPLKSPPPPPTSSKTTATSIQQYDNSYKELFSQFKVARELRGLKGKKAPPPPPDPNKASHMLVPPSYRQ